MFEKRRLVNSWNNIELDKMPGCEYFFSEIENIEQSIYGPKLFPLKKYKYINIMELLIVIVILIGILILI